MDHREPVYVEVCNENGQQIYYISRIEIPENFKLVCCERGEWSSIDTIKFEFCKFTEFPRAQHLLELLPHLTKLRLINCRLTKLSCEDLRGLKNLKVLDLKDNDIVKLPKGLFDFTPKLEWISFNNNEIEEIDADILKPLRDLSHFDLVDNLSIDVLYDEENFILALTLEQLQEVIKEHDPIELAKHEMREEVELVKNDVADMSINVESLEKEVEKLKVEKADLEVKFEEKYNKLTRENTNLKRRLRENEKIFNELRAEIKQLKGIVECDFTVVINGKNFKVNKEVLTANSAVLAKLINDNPGVENLELFDISEETFKIILKFMQTKKPPNENANHLELFAAAARLEMQSLIDLSVGILMEKITPENALEIMRICHKFGHKELCQKALKVFAKSV